MELLKNTVLIAVIFILSVSCNHLDTQTEIIEVLYVNWACDCPDFIETKYFKDSSNYEIKEENCIYIEPANKNFKIPDNYYTTQHFDYVLKLTGKFYTNKGVPKSQEKKTPERPQKAKIFCYEKYEFVKRE